MNSKSTPRLCAGVLFPNSCCVTNSLPVFTIYSQSGYSQCGAILVQFISLIFKCSGHLFKNIIIHPPNMSTYFYLFFGVILKENFYSPSTTTPFCRIMLAYRAFSPVAIMA